jgi:hypothetical protein
MEISKAAGTVLDAGPPSPHGKLAELIRKFTSHRIRFWPRTRAILVFVGAIFIIVSWLTPWYNSLTWALPRGGVNAIGYESTNLLRGDIYAKYGLHPWSATVTGRGLTTGPVVLRSIAFSGYDFCSWVVLAVLALVAAWIYEKPREDKLTIAARRRIYLAFQSGTVLLLVFIVARCVWKGYDLASKAKVSQLAQQALYGGPAPAVAHYVTNYSFGLTILPLGVIFVVLGVFSGDKALKVKADAFGNQVQVIPRVHVKTAVLAITAIVFIAVAYGLFNG